MIEFKNIEYKNIMSVGNSAIKVDLNRSPTTVIGGPNGSGKSTLLLAFTYCLFGKIINGMKLGQAINSVNQKNLSTKVEFSKHGDDWAIVRGEKPKRFEIYKNGDMIDQYANARDQQRFLEVILGMDYKLFTQVILLNKERYIPFMEMGAGDRRKIIEDLLGISVFSVMNDVTKARITELKGTESTIERKRENKRTEMQGQSRLIKQIQETIKANSDSAKEELDSKNAKLESAKERLRLMEEELESFDTTGWDKVQKQMKEFQSLANDFTRQIKDAKKLSRFFLDNDHCPTCEQEISEQLKESKSKEADEEIKKIECVIEEMLPELEKINVKNTEFGEISSKQVQINNAMGPVKFEIKTLNEDIKDIMRRSSTASEKDKLDDHINQYDEMESHLEELTKDLTYIIEQREKHEALRELLKDDGIKALIVKEYNAVMNKKINDYLQAMDFYVSMTLDESFKETFHSMGRDKFTYENLSSGQKTRVNIAITLALLEVAALKNSVVTNVMFMDEILEPVDAEGIKNVMSLFKEKLPNKNIFCITQRYDEFEDQFQSAIKFQLNQGFTEIV